MWVLGCETGQEGVGGVPFLTSLMARERYHLSQIQRPPVRSIKVVKDIKLIINGSKACRGNINSILKSHIPVNGMRIAVKGIKRHNKAIRSDMKMCQKRLVEWNIGQRSSGRIDRETYSGDQL